MLYTIGHSTQQIDEFVGLLEAHGIEQLVDVRTVPRSRTNPQYNLDVLPGELAAHGIGYLHSSDLGGLRHVRKDSINTAWQNRSFQGYADYMQTPSFDQALDQLVEFTEGHAVVIMCAEAVWWRCHRSMIADAMLARGYDVRHIMPNGRLQPATLRAFAVVRDGRVTYPGVAPG